MDAELRKEAIREQARKKFKGKQKLASKVRPHYPVRAEREYQRVTNAYMLILSKIIKEKLVPEIRKAANAELEPGYWRRDSEGGLMRRLAEAFDKCERALERETRSFDLTRRIAEVAALTTKLSIKDWKQMVKETVGIDLLDDYYAGEFYKKALAAWTKENVDLIKTIPHDTLGRLREIVLDGYRNGRTTTKIVKAIQKAYGVNRRHAQLIARDQMAKLNSDVTQKQQEDAGVKEYEWSTSGDSRVRDSHRKLNGKRFRWDDPPVVDEKTRRRCHPGQDYQCRCVALPVFDIDTLDL